MHFVTRVRSCVNKSYYHYLQCLQKMLSVHVYSINGLIPPHGRLSGAGV